MKCPYCNGEMKSGYIQSVRPIFWGEKKHKLFFQPHGDEEFNISKGFLAGCSAESYFCIKCRKLIIEL